MFDRQREPVAVLQLYGEHVRLVVEVEHLGDPSGNVLDVCFLAITMYDRYLDVLADQFVGPEAACRVPIRRTEVAGDDPTGSEPTAVVDPTAIAAAGVRREMAIFLQAAFTYHYRTFRVWLFKLHDH